MSALGCSERRGCPRSAASAPRECCTLPLDLCDLPSPSDSHATRYRAPRLRSSIASGATRAFHALIALTHTHNMHSHSLPGNQGDAAGRHAAGRHAAGRHAWRACAHTDAKQGRGGGAGAHREQPRAGRRIRHSTKAVKALGRRQGGGRDCEGAGSKAPPGRGRGVCTGGLLAGARLGGPSWSQTCHVRAGAAHQRLLGRGPLALPRARRLQAEAGLACSCALGHSDRPRQPRPPH